MSKLTRFFGTCVLVVSLSGIAFAGDTLTPPVPPPPPAECTSESTGTEATAPALTVLDFSTDMTGFAQMFVSWLGAPIL
jgi:hypothetical protein